MAQSDAIFGTDVFFKVGSVVYSDDILSAVIKTEEADYDPTAAEARAGGAVKRFLEVEAIQSTKGTSLHMLLEDGTPGSTATVMFGVHGNTTAADDKRIGTFTVKIPALKPDLGGPMQTKGRYKFATKFEIVGSIAWDEGV